MPAGDAARPCFPCTPSLCLRGCYLCVVRHGVPHQVAAPHGSIHLSHGAGVWAAQPDVGGAVKEQRQQPALHQGLGMKAMAALGRASSRMQRADLPTVAQTQRLNVQTHA